MTKILVTIKKDPSEADESLLVTRVQKSLHQLRDEAMRWKKVVATPYEQFTAQKVTNIPCANHTRTI